MNSDHNSHDPGRTSKPVLDLKGVMQRVQNDMDLFQDFIKFYDDESDRLLQSIGVAVRGRNAEQLHHSAHTLKGLVANLGGEAVMDAALRLERAGKSEDWTEVDEDFHDLQVEVDLLEQELQRQRR